MTARKVMSVPEAIAAGRPTVSVPAAGEFFFDLGSAASYEAAKRGDIPTLRVGRLLRVPLKAMEAKLEAAA